MSWQSVIITGESGAGKSEACKLVLQFIADLSAAHSGRTVSEDESSLEQQLLQVGCRSRVEVKGTQVPMRVEWRSRDKKGRYLIFRRELGQRGPNAMIPLARSVSFPFWNSARRLGMALAGSVTAWVAALERSCMLLRSRVQKGVGWVDVAVRALVSPCIDRRRS